MRHVHDPRRAVSDLGGEGMNALNERLHSLLHIRNMYAIDGPYPSRMEYKYWDGRAREAYKLIAAIRRPWDVSA